MPRRAFRLLQTSTIEPRDAHPRAWVQVRPDAWPSRGPKSLLRYPGRPPDGQDRSRQHPGCITPRKDDWKPPQLGGFLWKEEARTELFEAFEQQLCTNAFHDQS